MNWGRLAGLAGAIGLLGCLLGAAAPFPASRPDILLITIDTLRADAPGFGGNPRDPTPLLDRLAARGRVFTDAHAHNVVTLPSHTNILTGLYPYQHGVRDNSGFRLPASIPTLGTVLRDAGYATGAFVGSFSLDHQFGLNRGFQVYDDRSTLGADTQEFVIPERRGTEVVAAALAWWREKRPPQTPRFLWVHLFDPHAPYDPPEPFATRFKDNPYLGEVAAADAALAPLLDLLLGGNEPSCFVVVTADHGEALGDHGELTHGLFAYEATLKIPLVLWGPGVQMGKDARAARHVDIFPTVLQAAGLGVPANPAHPGVSLLAPPVAGDSYFESLSATLNRGWAPLRGLLRSGHKHIALPLPESYDLGRDPGETRNLVDAERATARAAFAALPKESVWLPPRGAVRAEDEARLRSLGYAGGTASARQSYGPDDDPKKLVQLDAKIHRVIELYGLRRLDESVRLAREVTAARPGMPLGWSLLAQALLESGKTGEALDVMRKARAAKVASDSLLRQLGLTLAETGKTADALDVLRPLAETGDLQSMIDLATALSAAGREREAWDLVQKVLKTDPDNAKAWEDLGLLELRLGHWPQARDASQHAVALQRQRPLAWNNLGVAFYQLGDREHAVDAWQQAVTFKADLWDALWNLGLKAAEIGRAKQSRAALERFVAGAPSARYGDDIKKAREMLGRLQ
jgi:arylsulfatase A-like enzyme/cytochrome c-type biogenesis protein CcmH/NrfG